MDSKPNKSMNSRPQKSAWARTALRAARYAER